MKTITLDFDLYERELVNQFRIGRREALSDATRMVRQKASKKSFDDMLAEYCDDDEHLISFAKALYPEEKPK